MEEPEKIETIITEDGETLVQEPGFGAGCAMGFCIFALLFLLTGAFLVARTLNYFRNFEKTQALGLGGFAVVFVVPMVIFIVYFLLKSKALYKAQRRYVFGRDAFMLQIFKGGIKRSEKAILYSEIQKLKLVDYSKRTGTAGYNRALGLELSGANKKIKIGGNGALDNVPGNIMIEIHTRLVKLCPHCQTEAVSRVTGSFRDN